jgi:hypothetical protein
MAKSLSVTITIDDWFCVTVLTLGGWYFGSYYDRWKWLSCQCEKPIVPCNESHAKTILQLMDWKGKKFNDEIQEITLKKN